MRAPARLRLRLKPADILTQLRREVIVTIPIGECIYRLKTPEDAERVCEAMRDHVQSRHVDPTAEEVGLLVDTMLASGNVQARDNGVVGSLFEGGVQ